MKLNLGCGHVKIEGFVNIDVNPDVKPDLVGDITKSLPYANDSVSEIWLIHVIEHIQKKYHIPLYMEMNRILKKNGIIVMAYPEFVKCAMNYVTNKKGKRDFWEMTVYGRQNTPSDFHVSLMDSSLLVPQLISMGFGVTTQPQEGDDYYTVLKGVKLRNVISRDDVVRQEIFDFS